jgi:myo-inositol catabolism protein IolC
MGPTNHPWFVLACDHRRPHLAALLDRSDDPGPADRARIVDAKRVVADGFRTAVDGGVDPRAAGLLIDEEYGAEAARTVIAAGGNVAMPVEASGLDHFAFADPGILDRVLAIGPRWVKALVRYNVEGDAAANDESLRGLTELRERLGRHGPGLMLEVIVPPTERQLAAAGSPDAFARTRRPELAAAAMRALLDAGLAPELWKVEGVDEPGAAPALSEAAGTADRPAPILVLGAGASQARVDHWLRVAAATPGFAGFAVGRSLWWEAIRGLLAQRCDRATAVGVVAGNFRHAVDVYEGATGSATAVT